MFIIVSKTIEWEALSMDLKYTVIDPTGNITVLVTSPVLREKHRAVAQYLLSLEPQAEQVGFLEECATGDARLQMMGGEFCGNATMSLGAWLCRDALSDGMTQELSLEVSGVSGLVGCSVTGLGDCFIGTVHMPLPEKVELCRFPLGSTSLELPVVFLPGICHIIAPSSDQLRSEAEQLLRAWSAQFPHEAVGLLLLDEDNMSFRPLVYVKNTDTAVWENGCGSGTAAIGTYMTARYGASQCLSVKQPGGTIAVATQLTGNTVTSLTITGTIKLGKEKSAFFVG